MRKLLIFALVGMGAQLVDGALGMGYGVTSTTLLLLAGLTPAAASASVHFSELGTNIASGVSHWRLRNVDWRVVARIAGPGVGIAVSGEAELRRFLPRLTQLLEDSAISLGAEVDGRPAGRHRPC